MSQRTQLESSEDDFGTSSFLKPTRAVKAASTSPSAHLRSAGAKGGAALSTCTSPATRPQHSSLPPPLTLLASVSRLLEDLDAEHTETTVEVDNPVEWTYDGDKTFTDYEVRVRGCVWAFKGSELETLVLTGRLPPVSSILTPCPSSGRLCFRRVRLPRHSLRCSPHICRIQMAPAAAGRGNQVCTPRSPAIVGGRHRSHVPLFDGPGAR